jgi:hypothetical protein
MRVVARILLLCAAVGSGSCLVVSDPDFRGQEDCIPFFVTQQASPALTAKTLILASSASALEFRGDVPMRSCALTKTYEMHVFLDDDWKRLDTVPPTGEEERNVTALVDISRAKPGCHQVEVLLSTRFSSADPKAPERANDLAYLTWWFANDSNTKFEQCGSR